MFAVPGGAMIVVPVVLPGANCGYRLPRAVVVGRLEVALLLANFVRVGGKAPGVIQFLNCGALIPFQRQGSLGSRCFQRVSRCLMLLLLRGNRFELDAVRSADRVQVESFGNVNIDRRGSVLGSTLEILNFALKAALGRDGIGN